MTEEFYEYLQDLLFDRFNLTYTLQPATVVSFDTDANTLSMNLDQEDIVLEDIPISIFGNKDSYISTPTFEAGTKGLLGFSKHDLQIWAEVGVDRDAKSDFSKNNAFFIVGASWNENKISNYNMNAIEIKTNKAFECFIAKHILLDAKDSFEAKAVLDMMFSTAGKFSASSDLDMMLDSKASTTLQATTKVEMKAPKLSLTNTATGEELFSLLVDTFVVMKNIAHELTLSKDTADNSPLTNQSAFATLEGQIESLILKFEGFK